MKKNISILLLIVIVFSLCACGGNKSAKDTNKDNSAIQNQTNTNASNATEQNTDALGSATDNNSDLSNTDVSGSSASNSSTATKPESSKPSATTKPNASTGGSNHTHSYSTATCTEPAKCSCGATNGKALGHKWNSPSCGQFKECTMCGINDGTEIEHNYVKGRCENCKGFEEFYTTGETLLEYFLGVEFYYIGIANGTDIKIRIKNTLNQGITVGTENNSVNGDNLVDWQVSEKVEGNRTKEMIITPYADKMKECGYDSIEYIEFKFYFTIKEAGTIWTQIYDSPNNIKIYPYS